MMQQPTQSCPNCRSPLVPGQRFCANCGTTIDIGANKLTEHGPSSIEQMDTRMSTPPPPPQQMFQQRYEPVQEHQSPPAYQPPPIGYQPPPQYAQPQKDSSKSVLGQIGCGFIVVIGVILALCGTASYFAYAWVRDLGASSNTTTSRNTTNTTSGNQANATATTATIQEDVPLNVVITYAQVKMTLLKAQLSNFTKETHPEQPGVLRLYLKEENTSKGGNFLYSDMMRIITPEGTSIPPTGNKYSISPGANSSRLDNWIDFPVPLNVKVNQLILRLGQDVDAQMDVPLKQQADVSKYATKSVKLDKQTQYEGVAWTMTGASMQWSADGKQAPKGKIYVVVTLKMDNNSTKGFARYPGDYMRLKAGETTSPLESFTIPTYVEKGQTGATGTCTFLMPQGNTNFTLLFLASTLPDSQDTSIEFQIA
jgi:hypothetical protein